MSATRFTRSRDSILSFGAVALFAVTAATAQVATGIDASGSYQKEVQACMSGNTQQDRDTCLKEARNAQADKKRGVLETNTTSSTTTRCDVLNGDEKTACIARMSGGGTVSGSVAGGGVIREVETVTLPSSSPTGTVVVQQQTSGPLVILPATN